LGPEERGRYAEGSQKNISEVIEIQTGHLRQAGCC